METEQRIPPRYYPLLLHDTLSPTVSPSEPVLKSEDRYAGFILPRFEKKIVAPSYVLKFRGSSSTGRCDKC